MKFLGEARFSASLILFRLPKLKMEILGWIGTALVIVAYYPQIHHLWAEKCAWGISVLTWSIWLLASLLLLIYAWLRNDSMFAAVQIINILAITVTILLVRRSNSVCPEHLASSSRKQDSRQSLLSEIS